MLVPSPHWAGDKPHFKRVSVKIIGESASRRLQLSRGDLDCRLPCLSISFLRSSRRAKSPWRVSVPARDLSLSQQQQAPLNQVDFAPAPSGQPIIRGW
ncbi:hypothetical protein KIF59_02880 [Enterobacter cloacae subsp. cloacae]|nr:hypothetical protein [Enterobacter cloacae subsp. cloacae]